MRKSSLRKIVIHGIAYRWKITHKHHPTTSKVDMQCTDVFSAFLENAPRAPLRIVFAETIEHGSVFPFQAGVIADRLGTGKVINLNRPKVARTLIELGLRHGWNPTVCRRDYVIANGYDLLNVSPHSEEASIIETMFEVAENPN